MAKKKDYGSLSRQEKLAEATKPSSSASFLRRNLFMISVVAVALGLIAGAYFVATSNAPDFETSVIEPEGATEDFGVLREARAGAADPSAEPAEPVRVTLYEDFSCPYCKMFAEVASEPLTEWVEAGQVTIEYRPVAFMDANGGSLNNHSRRAGSASLCVAAVAGGEGYARFHDEVYQVAPEGGNGPSDKELLELAREVAPEVSEECVLERRYVPWLEEATKKFQANDAITSTPSVLVEGELVETEAALQAIEQAVKERFGA